MTFTNLSPNPMPERVVLDIDAQEPMFTWLCEQYHEDEAELYAALTQCLAFEHDAEYEFEYFLAAANELFTQAALFAPVMRQTVQSIYRQLKELKLYEYHILHYEFDRASSGHLVLVRMPSTVREIEAG